MHYDEDRSHSNVPIIHFMTSRILEVYCNTCVYRMINMRVRNAKSVEGIKWSPNTCKFNLFTYFTYWRLSRRYIVAGPEDF